MRRSDRKVRKDVERAQATDDLRRLRTDARFRSLQGFDPSGHLGPEEKDGIYRGTGHLQHWER